MDVDEESLARVIGVRVKSGRKGRQWTLDQLAAAANVNRRMVVSVEQGSVNPSLGALLRLSDALDVGLPSLVEPPAPWPAKVTRQDQGAVLWSGDRGGQGGLVAGTEPPHVVELWNWWFSNREWERHKVQRAPMRESAIGSQAPVTRRMIAL